MCIPAIQLEYLEPADMVLVGSHEPGDHVINIFSHLLSHDHRSLVPKAHLPPSLTAIQNW